MKKTKRSPWPKPSWILGAFCVAPLTLSASEMAATVEFNQSFLRSPVDVRTFAESNPVPPGVYRIDLYVNEHWKGRTEVRFELPGASARAAQPCYDAKLLDRLGLSMDKLGEKARAELQTGAVCVPLGDIVAGAQAEFDSGAQRLDVAAPQALLQRVARGYVSPELWDDGITAGTLQYDYNAYHSEMSNQSSYTSQYLGLRAGLNVGAWRVRYHGSANSSSPGVTRFQNAAIFAERGIAPWRSRLTIGESSTDGQVFDSIGFRGVRLASDDRMYADSQRGFAPVVRGIANSNARVRISQRGTQIYETTVPPGPFVIDDIYPMGTGGDLLVTVTEANGTEQSFVVTYASIAELLRPGVTHYTLVAGQYWDGAIRDKPLLAVGTLQHGFTNLLTGYSGLIGAEGYAAGSAGLALNTRSGALAADITQARTDLRHEGTHSGQSLRLTYAKILPVIDTNVTLASYRYSSSGYYDPVEAFALRDQATRHIPGAYGRQSGHRRSRFLVNAAQTLPKGYGAVAAYASTQNYWGRGGTDVEYQVSYNNQFRSLNLGISASRTRNLTENRWDNQIMGTVSMPLGRSWNAPSLSTSFTDRRDDRSAQAALAGSFGADRQYRYNAYTSVNTYNAGDTRTSGGVSGLWSAPYATLGGSYSTDRGYRQYGANLSGGVVAYGGGVVLSPSLGDTIGVVEAEHAGGARVTNYSGVCVDGNGHAVVPYLSPYRQNSVEIDPKGISTDVELKSTSQDVAPTAGAVSLLRFVTERGYSVLVSGYRVNGEPLPFAAGIFDEQGGNVGYVAQGSQSIVRVARNEGSLVVKWGEQPGQRCTLDYAVDANPKAAGTEGLRRADAVCQ